MSIFDNNTEEVIIPPATIIANTLIDRAKETYYHILQAYTHGIIDFWSNAQASPEEISAALGNNAKEIFELHYKLGQILVNVNPNAIAQANNLIGNFTMNEDGTVTIL